MRQIGILGGDHDIHTSMVAWGLSQFSTNKVKIWNWYDFPSKVISSISIPSGSDVSAYIDESRCDIFDVIWLRRPGKPMAHQSLHASDIRFSESESADYISNFIQFLGNDRTLWVNHPERRNVARNKAIQLLKAQQLGFKIPDTVFSNSPPTVRNFCRDHGGRLIYKPFRPAEWRFNRGDNPVKAILPTTLITDNDLSDDFPIMASPGIYQEVMSIDYEIRSTVIGDQVISCKIHSQHLGDAIDWRHELDRGRIPIEPFELPEAVERRCVELCARLGLSFGCFDFIVDKNGEFVFIEINESGQFLWKEEMLPEIGLLQCFCNFLSGEVGHHGPQIRLSNYLDSCLYAEDRQRLEDQYTDNRKLLDDWRLYRE